MFLKFSLKDRDFTRNVMRFRKEFNNDVTSLCKKNGYEISLKKKEDDKSDGQRRKYL